MTPAEIGAVLCGLVAGYWIVSKLFSRVPRAKGGPEPAPDGAAAGGAAPPPSAAPAWNEVLQVAPTAGAAEIRDAYKHLISKYHPDKVDSLGQELKDLAGHKTQEITAAYRAGMRARGLDP